MKNFFLIIFIGFLSFSSTLAQNPHGKTNMPFLSIVDTVDKVLLNSYFYDDNYYFIGFTNYINWDEKKSRIFIKTDTNGKIIKSKDSLCYRGDRYITEIYKFNKDTLEIYAFVKFEDSTNINFSHIYLDTAFNILKDTIFGSFPFHQSFINHFYNYKNDLYFYGSGFDSKYNTNMDLY